MQSTAYFQTPTTDLKKSQNYYLKLGFEKLGNVDDSFFTDGKLSLKISDDKFARKEIGIIRPDWNEIIREFEKTNSVFKSKDGSAVLSDPNGVRVRLLTQKRPDWSVSGKSFGKLGSFAGVSVETISFENSMNFWSKLGYELAAGGVDKGWMTLSCGNGVDVSFMGLDSCPHSFSNPGLTYFNSGKNLEFIKQIREAGIPISEEITAFNEQGIADNIILRDPGHTLFFVFND